MLASRPGGMARIGMPAGVIAALAVYGSSLAGIANVDRRLAAAEADRARGDATRMLAARGQEACELARPVRLRRSSPDA